MSKPTVFALDILYDWNWCPKDPSEPMAAAYGWASYDGGKWKGEGQRPSNHAESLPSGGTLHFSFFDGASQTAYIQKLQITWAPGEIAQDGQPDSPFEKGLPNADRFRLGPGGSAGCNLDCDGGTPFPNGLGLVKLEEGQSGDWELTLSFEAVDANGDVKAFRVDPEMSVGRGG